MLLNITTADFYNWNLDKPKGLPVLCWQWKSGCTALEYLTVISKSHGENARIRDVYIQQPAGKQAT